MGKLVVADHISAPFPSYFDPALFKIHLGFPSAKLKTQVLGNFRTPPGNAYFSWHVQSLE